MGKDMDPDVSFKEIEGGRGKGGRDDRRKGRREETAHGVAQHRIAPTVQSR